MKTNQLIEMYRRNMHEMLENIVIQLWTKDFSDEEIDYFFFGKKLKKLDKNKYYLMGNMYNIITDAREEAYLIQKKLDNYLKKLQK